MIELISIIAAIAVIVLVPIEVAKVQKGWVRKSFKGTPDEFRAAYRKQMTFMLVIGIVFGVLNIGLGIIEQVPGENYVKYFCAVLWFVVSAMGYYARNKLSAPVPGASPPT